MQLATTLKRLMQARNWTPSDLNRREPRLRHCFLTHALKGRSGRMRKPGVMVLAKAFDGDAPEVLKAYFLDQLGQDAKWVDISVKIRVSDQIRANRARLLSRLAL